MKIVTRIKNTLLVALTLFTFQGFSQILTNGDFESGGSGVGFFVHDYTLINPLTGASNPGNYARTTNPALMNSTYNAGGDHTTGTGNMLVFDGATLTNRFFWTTGSTGGAIVGFTAGSTYTFSYWIKSVSNAVTSNTATRANIGVFFVNANAINPPTLSNFAPLPADGWQRVSYSFVATANNVMVRLQTLNAGTVGCDFAVDDFSITPGGLPFVGSYTTVNPTCPPSTDGSITVTLSGGNLPYGTYNLTGTVNQSNTTGIFTGLPVGTYNVSVSDFAGATYSATNIVLSIPNDLQLSSPVSICQGQSTTLTATGGDGTYTWTASPSDTSITNPNAATQNVSPTTTTTYTVTSGALSSPTNLVVNGNFTQGNVGFSTGYTLVANPNPLGVQSSYNIVTNPSAWFNAFSACGDHTTGTGNMMVFDGATTAGTQVWCSGTSIAVAPNTNYTFSYYVATVAAGSPARLEVLINGVSLAAPVSASTNTCLWTLVSHTWNSGANTTANICIFNRELSGGGNDFALDDISLKETITCLYQKTVVVTVTNPQSATVSCGVSTNNSVTFNWTAVIGVTNYSISYTVNGGTPISGGTTTLTTYTVNSLNTSDLVQVTITPNGSPCFTAGTAVCVAAPPCVVPSVSVTQQPTCTVNTGTIVFTSPLNTGPLPIPSDLFISEVTDESTGALSYIEIFNGTGAPKNLANYKLKIYNNGNATPSNFCDFALSGTLNNNDVYVVAVGSATNQGGVVPDLAISACPGYNTNDNVRLATSADVEFDLWGRTDGIDFTPSNQSGYTYRRLAAAIHPTMLWNPADWTALDPQDYTNIGTYTFTTTNYEYSVNGVTYQASPIFTGLAPGTYNVTVRDLISGCVSTPIALIVNPIPVPPSSPALIFCDGANTTATQVAFDFNSIGQNSFDFTYSIAGGAPVSGTIPFSPSSYIVTGVSQGQAVTLTIAWNGVCTAPLTITCYPDCVTPVTPTFTQVAPICAGDTLLPLPTTSLNGVDGTWTPALNNAATTTYTFTPSNPSECGTTTTMTIVVNAPALTITNPPAACSPATVNLTLPAVTAGTTGGGTLTYWTDAAATIALASPSAVTTGGTYYIKSTVGSCFDIEPVTVTINPSPVLTITNPAAVCSPATVNLTLPAITAGTTGGGTLTYWTDAAATIALASPSAVTTGGTYYIKSTVGSCFDIEPVTVTINPSPVLTITNPPAACSPATVNLTLPAITAGTTGGGTLTYWTNAAATTALASPSAITTGGTYYIKSTVGSCFDIEPVTVTINPSPVLTITNPAAVCSPATVNLTLPAVTAGSTGGGTLTYWTNAAATIALATPSAVTTGGTYYIKSTVGSCFDIEPVTVTINPTLTPTFNFTQSVVCYGATITPLPTTSLNGISGTWTPTLNNTATTTYTFNPVSSLSVPCPVSVTYEIEVIPQIVPVISTVESCNSNSVTVTSPIGINYQYSLDGGAYQSNPVFNNLTNGNHSLVALQTIANCTSSVINFTINPIANDVIVTNPQPLHYCDPSNDGFVTFDLSQIINSVTGGSPYLVTFHETLTDAGTGGSPIPDIVNYDNINPWSQLIYIRVESNTSGCFETVPLQLIVDPTPEATTPDDYELCDYTGQVGFESFDLTTTVPQILGAIDPATVTVTFHTTQVDAQDDANAIGGVTNYINQTQWNQTVYVRVEFITTGCYDIVALDLIVNPLPNATQPNYPQYTLCDYNGAVGFETFDLASQVAPILLNQTGMEVTFYPSLTDAQNDANAITISHPDLQYPNQIIYVQTLGVRITNMTTGCYSISTIDIRVSPLPTPIPPTAPYTICDDNQDGFAGFDLLTLTTDILQGANYILTFHETLTDAQQGNSAIDTTVLYDNINPFFQILYVRAVDPATGCWSVISIELNVNPSPIAPIDLDDIVVCDEDNNTQNAITIVDLTQRTPDALAQQPLAPSNYTVEYYTSQTAAQDGIAPIINAASYTAMNTQTIWVRVENNTTGCYNIGSFDIIINIPLLLTTPAPLSVCDDDANPNDQYHSFDLTVKDAEITQNLPGYTVTYYPSLALAQVGGATTITDFTAYTNITPAVQTLGVVVTSAAGCQSITTLDIRVLPIPTPNTNPPSLGAQCDDNNPGDMLEVFDLTVNAAYILNGDPNLTLHYYHSQADALVPQNEIPLATVTAALVGDVDPAEQSVWIRVENNRVDYLGNRCFVLVEQPLTVNPLPEVIQPLAPYRMCDDNTDGIAQFDLTNPDLAIAILGANQSPADFTITYYLTAAGANPFTNTGETPLVSPYTNVTAAAQDIYIRVVNNATGCVNATGVLNLAVEEYATATGPQEFSSCDDYLDPYDGVFQLDLTQFDTAILNGQDPLIFLISYYHTQADAEAGTNAITLAEAQTYITQADTDQIWVKVENSSNSILPVCYALTTIDIEIERYPNPVISTPNGVTTICVDFTSGVVVRPLTLDSNIPNPADYTFEWYEDGTLIAGATGSTYTVNTSSATGATRNYHVRVISNSPLLCETTTTDFSVIQSGQAVAVAGTVGYTVTNAFTDSQIITVTVEGWGSYEYSLDDGPRQASNIFEGVSLGTHTIHVWDTEGGLAFSCEELTIEDVMVIDYPHYFTPNGDGFHDTWNVVGLSNFAEQTTIYIFDRYGKLLKQLSASNQSDGWDGTYNGKPLPSTDYWFTVDFPEQGVMKQFKAHFSLKR